MSLLSRTVLIIMFFVSLVLLALAVKELGDPSASDLDRLVAARNFRRAIAYRVVDLQGGKVAKSAVTDSMYDNLHGLSEEDQASHPGSLIPNHFSLIALEAHERNLTESELLDQVKKLRDGWKDGEREELGIQALKSAIAEKNRVRRQKVSELTTIQDRIRLFAQELDGYSYMIQSFQQRIFNLDYEVHLAIVERNALQVEKAQVEADNARLKRSQADMEDANYELSKKYAKTVEVVAQYEQYDPSVRGWADRVGNPWVRGVVLRAHEDSRVGLVWVSVGQNEGVKPGQLFSIHRGPQFVGRMRIESVRANDAVGKLLEEFRGLAYVHANDRIVGSPNFGEPMWTRRE